jgi:hypothetical protein
MIIWKRITLPEFAWKETENHFYGLADISKEHFINWDKQTRIWNPMFKGVAIP